MAVLGGVDGAAGVGLADAAAVGAAAGVVGAEAVEVGAAAGVVGVEAGAATGDLGLGPAALPHPEIMANPPIKTAKGMPARGRIFRLDRGFNTRLGFINSISVLGTWSYGIV